VLTFLPFATLFERGGNTIWAPAVVHFAADCIIPLGVLGLAPPAAIVYWMGAQVAACCIAYVLVQRVGPRDPQPRPSSRAAPHAIAVMADHRSADQAGGVVMPRTASHHCASRARG
jgi:hypothetical protein